MPPPTRMNKEPRRPARRRKLPAPTESALMKSLRRGGVQAAFSASIEVWCARAIQSRRARAILGWRRSGHLRFSAIDVGSASRPPVTVCCIRCMWHFESHWPLAARRRYSSHHASRPHYFTTTPSFTHPSTRRDRRAFSLHNPSLHPSCRSTPAPQYPCAPTSRPCSHRPQTP